MGNPTVTESNTGKRRFTFNITSSKDGYYVDGEGSIAYEKARTKNFNFAPEGLNDDLTTENFKDYLEFDGYKIIVKDINAFTADTVEGDTTIVSVDSGKGFYFEMSDDLAAKEYTNCWNGNESGGYSYYTTFTGKGYTGGYAITHTTGSGTPLFTLTGLNGATVTEDHQLQYTAGGETITGGVTVSGSTVTISKELLPEADPNGAEVTISTSDYTLAVDGVRHFNSKLNSASEAGITPTFTGSDNTYTYKEEAVGNYYVLERVFTSKK